ncbi:ATP-dependent Clp protease ATP-binding subunit ClpA [Chryseobacterium defluvii]|uniref:ATP-dependent Clp protease ATP-binding subunit ClpA n=1 Tax=Chryseobacterium defluvii TaxID=160396 RepID=A0A840KKY9_9FLAO|nr:AAA family ATPase [Chryseobacterium defluvii]MBB4808304.1 ATP-dependent Clp protease ATP-binding subunit ClpA [Chryseobacterium defluvii]
MKNIESSNSFIDKYSIDFNNSARLKKYDPVFFRSSEIKKVIETLCRRIKNNVILLGHPGVGKTAIVECIAQMIVNDEVPEVLKNKKIYGIKMSNMLAGTSYRGEFEERAEQLLKEICNSEVILFIDELHTIMKAGASEGSVDFVNLLKPYIARGDIQLIGATTFVEYQHSILLDKALDRRFHKVTIEEPSDYITYLILKKIKYKYEAFYNILITDEAVLEAINLTKDIQDYYFPDKAIDLIDLACSSLVMDYEFLYSDEFIELEYKEELYTNLITDPLFKQIFETNHEIDILSVRNSKNIIIENFKINKKKIDEQKKNLKLVDSYLKEANAMKRQGYESKYEEILELIIPKIKEDLQNDKVELTKEFLTLFYTRSYGRKR